METEIPTQMKKYQNNFEEKYRARNGKGDIHWETHFGELTPHTHAYATHIKIWLSKEWEWFLKGIATGRYTDRKGI